MAEGGVREAAEHAARHSYGRLLSVLVRRTRDIAAAEDALSEALANALRVWPKTGIPDEPDAWLLTAARRAAGHAARRKGVQDGARATIEMMYETMSERLPPAFPDDRLKLLFACAHPAIDETVRTPLMLQAVLGLDAARISAAFLVQPAAMSQRLVRAKAKIRDAGVRFEVPEPGALDDRLQDVLAAVYAAYTVGWDMVGGAATGQGGLTAEALFLGRLVAALMPHEPEPRGLLALMLYSEARSPARRRADGAYIPLAEQDTRLWRTDLIGEAEETLREAAAFARFGRFQTEAAIQSLHVQSAVTGSIPAAPLLHLYDVLAVQSPTVGALVARAVAHGTHSRPETGLRLLDEIPASLAENYQPWWAARLHLMALCGDRAGAEAARERAMALTADKAVRDWLRARPAV